MPQSLDPKDVERLLRRRPVARAPDSLWERIQAALTSPETPRALPPLKRPVPRWLMAAAVFLAVLTGTLGGLYRSYRAPSAWAVQPVAGTPTIAGAALTGGDKLGAGEWLVTDAFSKAALSVGRIGTAEVGPNSRVQLDRGGLTQHRLTLERGRLQVVISAPPRLFFVRTPSALATDLGCAYTLDVDSAGASRLHVTAGWVELKEGDAVSVVPAGLVAEVAVGERPGTPYPPELADDARTALRRLDAGAGSGADLDALLAALHQPSDFITLRRQSGVTLWHLLPRVPPELRARVYQRLAELSAPPAGVTREGILALWRPMLERWRRDLSPMWSEDAESWWTRAARRLWERTID
ncbi:MAG: FecR domain-containing protein [Gemmatimonadetes bacterium]|nr:FecR domain-containing protein [Gemmatimonadota bacterium]